MQRFTTMSGLSVDRIKMNGALFGFPFRARLCHFANLIRRRLHPTSSLVVFLVLYIVGRLVNIFSLCIQISNSKQHKTQIIIKNYHPAAEYRRNEFTRLFCCLLELHSELSVKLKARRKKRERQTYLLTSHHSTSLARSLAHFQLFWNLVLNVQQLYSRAETRRAESSPSKKACQVAYSLKR